MYLPLMFKTDDLKVLLIGAGQVALRKLRILAELGAKITLVSPDILPEAMEIITRINGEFIRRIYEPGDCAGYDLVIAATSNMDVNRTISDEARVLHVPVNVVDVPELCTVIFPAVIREGEFITSVSTGGAAPFLAAEIRNRLREHSQGYGRWVETGGRFREIVLRSVEAHDRRRELYDLFLAAGKPGENAEPPESDDLDIWIDWLETIRNNDCK